MTEIFARDILMMSIDEVALELPREFKIIFDDSVTLVTTNKKALYSRYFWRFHEIYNRLPLTFNHYVDSVLKNEPLNSNTHIKLLTSISKDTINFYGFEDPKEIENISELIYSITNTIYNDLDKYTGMYVPTVDLEDFLELSMHPDVEECNDSVEENSVSIERVHNEVMGIISDSKRFPNNSITRAINSRMANANQATQCIAVRGFLTEVDGVILPNPVRSNFTKGLFTLHDYALESRSAAKSLCLAKAPLQDSQYFARRLQLVTMVVDDLYRGDCGSTDYLEWYVRPRMVEDGYVTYPGDLKFLKGKNYLDKESNTLRYIEGDETHLEGKVIKIRSVLKCKHEDPHRVCSTCFGKLSVNINKYSNLGHISSGTSTRQTSQAVLSNKHFQSSSVATDVFLNSYQTAFFRTNKEKSGIELLPTLKKKKLLISISKKELSGLLDILESDSKFFTSNVSNIEVVNVMLSDGKQNINNPIEVKQQNRKAMLTHDFINYISEKGWDIDDRGNFIFDCSDWDFSKTFLVYPETEYSFSDHGKQVAKIIETGLANNVPRGNSKAAVSNLLELHEKVNSKLNVNLALLETIIYSYTIPGDDGNYGLSRNASSTKMLNSPGNLIKNRSLAPQFDYQRAYAACVSPESYFMGDRPDSIMDVFIKPEEAIRSNKDNPNQKRYDI